MEKSLRILGLVSVLGAVGIVTGQVQRVGRVLTGQGGQVASRVDNCEGAGSKRASTPETVLQQILSWHFSNLQNQAIEVAKEQGREEAVGDVIKVNCYHMLTLMRPDQQQHEMHDVWQVQAFVPNDAGWKAVCTAPSLAKEILSVDLKAAKEIQDAWEADGRESVKDVTALGKRLLQEPGFKQLSPQDQNGRFRAEYSKLLAQMPKRTPAQNYGLAVDRSRKILAFAFERLNDRQIAEIKRFAERYDRDLNAVMAGKRPAFLNP